MTRWDAPDSFAEFVRDRHVELLRFAHVLTGDRHVAEDLVQDALERTGMSWRRIRRTDDPEGYVPPNDRQPVPEPAAVAAPRAVGRRPAGDRVRRPGTAR